MKKTVTSRWKGTDLFSRRIVITVPRSGVLVLAVAILAGFFSPVIVAHLLILTAVILTLIALATVIEARFRLRNFRYEMQEKIVAQLTDWIVPDDLPDLREVELAEIIEELEENVKTRHLRLSK